jgi:hypothetical protein
MDNGNLVANINYRNAASIFFIFTGANMMLPFLLARGWLESVNRSVPSYVVWLPLFGLLFLLAGISFNITNMHLIMKFITDREVTP